MQSATDVLSSLFRFSDENEDDEPEVIEQFVQNIENFSSQYGSEISVSYTAFNLRGPPSNFPNYGDYPQAFVMRTYGTWWDEAPSAQKAYMPQNILAIPSQDFVEVSFKLSVHPLEVHVYETYNPGALVRIWAYVSTTNSWIMLWEGEPEIIGDTPRIFSPPIKKTDVITNILRLEFNHKLLPYYTELDAILLKGRLLTNKVKIKNNMTYSSLFQVYSKPVVERGAILNSVIASNLHETIGSNTTLQTPEKKLKVPTQSVANFQQLPDETILCILQYLDLHSLSRCAQVNRQLNRLASDSILYRCIDLKPFWHCVKSQVLTTLLGRSKFLQKLDLSWCGSRNMIQPNNVINFLRESGAELTHLRMDCCDFINTFVFWTIANVCRHLQELCLRSVTGHSDWICLSSLTMLKRLDLYRTDISTPAAVSIVLSNPNLEHLNVGACTMLTFMDDVAIALGSNCPNLISVDFWKSYSLTPRGLRALSNCQNLQELDVGWCLQASSSGEWLSLIPGAQLRKLFLGALRGVCDRDLRSIVPRAPHLQQLDLLGVRAVTGHVCEWMLEECHELKLLDVSFCDQIQEAQVLEWRKRFPLVSIKRSFQSMHLNSMPNNPYVPM
ncbi:hypothetical protein EVAR_97126_1 [Eumeta japonica]|uniref:F-box domain-containing protein n=1 Tax=Eumeta variegata TaxID=151549 RepID=A0A4C1WRE4_EUMVA|nr:hypothetical protein EVAR_97126_1 [Eumeta japonica]